MKSTVVAVADGGRWFKLWCSSLRDPHLDNLSIEDFGRWAKLGAVVKEQGQEGKLYLEAPARTLCSSLQVDTFQDLIECVRRLPNVAVSSETTEPVSFSIEFRKWLKYQGDFSTQRVKRFREKNAQMKRSKRRGEEMRREEKRSPSGFSSPSETQPPPGTPPVVPQGGPSQNGDFGMFWEAYPKHEARVKAEEAFAVHVVRRRVLIQTILSGVLNHCRGRKWQEGIIPMPATWLNQHRWEDEVPPWSGSILTPKTQGNLAAARAFLDRMEGAERKQDDEPGG